MRSALASTIECETRTGSIPNGPTPWRSPGRAMRKSSSRGAKLRWTPLRSHPHHRARADRATPCRTPSPARSTRRRLKPENSPPSPCAILRAMASSCLCMARADPLATPSALAPAPPSTIRIPHRGLDRAHALGCPIRPQKHGSSGQVRLGTALTFEAYVTGEGSERRFTDPLDRNARVAWSGGQKDRSSSRSGSSRSTCRTHRL
jgi:hypothetical protein